MDELNLLVSPLKTRPFSEVWRIDALVETQASGQFDAGEVFLIERLGFFRVGFRNIVG